MDLASQIRTALTSLSLPPPSQAWLHSLISNRNPPPPLQSLVATAKTRLLAADLTTAGLLDAAAVPAISFPASIGSADVKEARLPQDVVVQVLDIENLVRSRWEQVEELEAIERGEQTRGREVVRLREADDNDEGDGAPHEDRPASGQRSHASSAATAAAAAGTASKNSTHKLVLQDCRGQKVFGLELKRIERFAVGKLNIGEKMVVKSGAVVARGTILLEPSNCKILGGKVEAWQKSWLDGRLARLRELVGADRR